MSDKTTNVVIAGLGGQGVLKASDILADAAFRAGLDVKKSELHGMSQRGGSVSSDVRLGRCVLSPMVPDGQADFLVVLSADQVEVNLPQLRAGGVLIEPGQLDEILLPSKKSLNIALLGLLSALLDIDDRYWMQALKAGLPDRLHDINIQSFVYGKSQAGQASRH
jgi:indolepyruvate ferredoxin oxidoreductase beta subunit